MADEDELFAQFLGEINSAVAEPVEDGGGASDTASVGEIEGGDTIAEDTARRKASTEVRLLYTTNSKTSHREHFFTRVRALQHSCVTEILLYCCTVDYTRYFKF